jgi:hypothetical protein
MAKMTRERLVKERRALKQQRKNERSEEAAAARIESADEGTVPEHGVDDTAVAEPPTRD